MKFKHFLGLTFAAAMMLFSGCGSDDSGPAALTLVSIEASGTDVLTGQATTVDLNGATAASGVPVDLTIAVTFSRALNEETISGSTVTIEAGGTTLTANISVADEVVTLTFTDELLRGTDYTITLSADVRALDGGVFTEASRIFTTGGVAPVTPPNESSQVAYWAFDGNTNDETGTYSTALESEITYTTDRHGQAESTVSFDGDVSLIEIAGADALLDTDDFTLSFWVKSNSSDKNENDETRGQFVMGLAGWHGFQFEIFGNYGGFKLAAQYSLDDQTSSAQDLWWSTTGNLGWQGWTFDKDVSEAGGLEAIMADQWAHVICTYDAATKIGAIYVNGELVKSQDYNLYGETHALYRAVGMGYAGNEAPGNRLAFGFIQGSENMAITGDWANPIGFPDNNHFKGELDDVRVFHASFSAADALSLYNDEAP